MIDVGARSSGRTRRGRWAVRLVATACRPRLRRAMTRLRPSYSGSSRRRLGGSVGGDLAGGIRLRESDKPVVVSMGDVAASSRYYIALPG